MAENSFSSRELIEAIYDVRDRVTRIEEKLNRTEGIAEKVDIAESKARQALLKSEENEKDIIKLSERCERDMDAQKINNRWAWGFVLTLVVSLLAKILVTGSL